MNNCCRNCKHWVEDDKPWVYPKGVEIARCSKIVMLTEGIDGSVWDSEPGKFKEGHQNDKAFVMDGSDYRANLWTLPEFCCSHYEEK